MRVNDLKIPGRATASGRSSSITNAFINAALPYEKLSDAEKLEILKFLQIDSEDVRCAYCGDIATEWDHFYPTVKNRKETGWFTEKANLVPACGKCNQSKGNKDWHIWIEGRSPLSPKSRGIAQLDDRINRLHAFERTFPIRKLDLTKIRETAEWKEYENLREDIVDKLRQADDMAKRIAIKVLEKARLAAAPGAAIQLSNDDDA